MPYREFQHVPYRFCEFGSRICLQRSSSLIAMHKILLVEGTFRSPGISLQRTFTSQIGTLVHASHTRESQSMKRLVVLPYLLSFTITMIRDRKPCSDRVEKQVFSLDLYPHARVGALLRLSIVDCWCDGGVVSYTPVFSGSMAGPTIIAHQ